MSNLFSKDKKILLLGSRKRKSNQTAFHMFHLISFFISQIGISVLSTKKNKSKSRALDTPRNFRKKRRKFQIHYTEETKFQPKC